MTKLASWHLTAVVFTVTALLLGTGNAYAQMDAFKKKGCELLIQQQEKFVNEYADKNQKPHKDLVDKAQKASSDFRSQKCTQYADLANKQSGLDDKIAKIKSQ